MSLYYTPSEELKSLLLARVPEALKDEDTLTFVEAIGEILDRMHLSLVDHIDDSDDGIDLI